MYRAIIMNKIIYYHNKKITIENFSLQHSYEDNIHKDLSRHPDYMKKELKQFLKYENGEDLHICCKDEKKCWKWLKEEFTYLEAAGGLIQQDSNVLFIKRLNRWDLPKGKLEKNEQPQEAAIRECEEECGITNLTVLKALNSSYHIYPYKNGYALKKTFWYLMTSNYKGKLTPQTEEDIETVVWMKHEDIKGTVLLNTYPAIKDVLTNAGIL